MTHAPFCWRLTLALAMLITTVASFPAAAQIPSNHNRSIRPAALRIAENPADGGLILSGIVGVAIRDDVQRDLSTGVTVSWGTGSTGGSTSGGTARIIIGPGQDGGAPGLLICVAFCQLNCPPQQGGSCPSLSQSYCICVLPDRPLYGPGFRIIAPLPPLPPDALITVSAFAMPGSVPEILGIDDTFTFTLAQLRCFQADLAGGGVDALTPDGTVDGTDFISFINSFMVGDAIIDPTADIAGTGEDGSWPDGTIDGSDFIAFINAFAAGC